MPIPLLPSQGLETIMESVNGELKCQLFLFLTDKGRVDKMIFLSMCEGKCQNELANTLPIKWTDSPKYLQIREDDCKPQ